VRIAREESSEEVGPNMTPFIDMMFILVIFFLATSRFHAEERDERIRLARSRSGMPIATVSDVLVINVDRDGRKIVDGKVRSLSELEEIVRARKAEREDAEVVIRPDRDVRYDHVYEALEVCTRLGFKSPHLASSNDTPTTNR
jgi:biopolymer transport protein ExbD